MEYEVIVVFDKAEFQKMVEIFLNEGWKCLGCAHDYGDECKNASCRPCLSSSFGRCAIYAPLEFDRDQFNRKSSSNTFVHTQCK